MKETMQPVRVWDLPTRVFHWTLAVSVVASVVTANIGGDFMTWHFRLGYLAFTLLGFRFVWGVVGGRWSRFASFIHSPATLARYLRGNTRPDEHLDVGHSPLGALSVLALLAILSLQVGTGLFADDEISNVGPLNRFVSGGVASVLTSWHKTWGQGLILSLIALHLGAIVFYRTVRGKRLIGPMVFGDKPLPPGVPASSDTWRTRTLAVLVVILCAVTVGWIFSLGA